MDQSAFKYLSREHIYPQNVYLNPFQGEDSHSNPGVFGAAANRASFYIPLAQPDYIISKKSESDIPQTTTIVQNSTTIPKFSQNSAAQLSDQNITSQIGFGKKQHESKTETEADNSDDSSIDTSGLEKVSETVLNAFQNPKMTVESVTFKGKEKKNTAQLGKGKERQMKILTKKQLKSRMKFI